MKRVIKYLAFIIFISGCSNDFSPNGPYEQKMVLYAVLDASSDTQYVDLFSTMDPAVQTLDDEIRRNEIEGADVILTADSNAFVFHDTTLNIVSGGTIRTIKRYVHYGIHIVPNTTYAVSVSKSGFTPVSAQLKSFSNGSILPLNTMLFNSSSSEKDLEFDLYFGKGSYAYLWRLYFEYERLTNGIWEKRIGEVPLYFDGDSPVFPGFDFAVNNGIVRKTVTGSIYRQTIAKLRSNPADTLRFNHAVIEMQQFDEKLYTYYSVVNSYPGGSSIRLDEADFSNIVNGYGVAGIRSKTTYRVRIASSP